MAKAVYVDLDFNNGARITNLPDATADQHPATYAQLKAAVEGISWKSSVRVAASTNITISSPGSTIDGITMATNDRVLLRGQTSQPENGIYIWNGAASAMTRALDANTAKELEQARVSVEEGSDAGVEFQQTTVNFTLGSGNVVFSAVGSSSPTASTTTAGIVFLATQGEVDAGAGGNSNEVVTPETLAAWAERPKRFVQNVGDNSATTFTYSHGLGTDDFIATVYSQSGNKPDVIVEIDRPSSTQVRVTFTGETPTTGEYRLVCIA